MRALQPFIVGSRSAFLRNCAPRCPDRRTVQPKRLGKPWRQRQGFFDYALKDQTPRTPTMAQAMANGRSILSATPSTISIFWSNAVTLGVALCCGRIIYFEWRSAVKKEIVASYHHRGTLNGASATESKSCAARNSSTNSSNSKSGDERLLSAGPKTSEQEQEAAESHHENVGQTDIRSSAAGSAAKSTSPAPRATESQQW